MPDIFSQFFSNWFVIMLIAVYFISCFYHKTIVISDMNICIVNLLNIANLIMQPFLFSIFFQRQCYNIPILVEIYK